MSKNIKRRSSISALALGAAISIGVAAMPVASAAPADEHSERNDQTATAPAFAASGLDFGNVLDKFRGIFSNKDAKQIANDVDSLRAELDKALNNKDIAKQLNLQGTNVESLQKFLKDLEANKDSLSGIAISIRDVQDAIDKAKAEAEKTESTENAEPTEPTEPTDKAEAEPKPETKPETGSETKPDKTSKSGIVELTMTTKDGKITTTTLEDLPEEALAQLREALKAVDNGNGSAGEGAGENADKDTGKDSDKKTESDKGTDSASLNEELRRLIALYEAGQTGNSEITKELLKRLQGENKVGDNNNVTGKNVNTVQNIEGGGSTSVAINVTPDGGLSITAGTGANAEANTKTGAEATKDTANIIDALNKLIEALGGKAPGTGSDSGETKPGETGNTGETKPDKPQTEEEAQRDRLVRAILALTSPEREANSPENAERNALIAITKALKEGKKVDLEQLTTEQLITVMDWLQNGIPEPETKPSEKATEKTTEKTTESKATETEKTKEKETETSKLKETETEKSSETSKSKESETEKSESKSSESSTTTTTSAKSKEEQIRDLNKAVQDEINALDSQKAASNSSYTRPTNRVQVGNNTGSKSGSGGSGSSTGSKSGSGSSGSNSGAATSTAAPAEQVSTEPTSEELAVTGNSTQIMLATLALLGLIGAGAVTVALRRTRDAE